MTDHSANAHALEVLSFCKQDSELQGRWPLSAMTRLVESLAKVESDAAVDWVVRGSLVPVTGGEAEVWLHLRAQASVSLQCQRCLQAARENLSVDRRFRFVRTEAEAASLDEDSEDDVLVLEPRLDLAVLLEDELILSLPIVPMHAVCPEPLRPAGGDAVVDEAPPHPFAALAALRKAPPKGSA